MNPWHRCTMSDNDVRTLVLDQNLLDSMIELTDGGGEMAHRAIHHLLRQLRTMGYAHRDVWSIRLFNGDSDADLDPSYAEHLDRLNSGLPSDWGQPHEEER
jgi:hypothetical protein